MFYTYCSLCLDVLIMQCKELSLALKLGHIACRNRKNDYELFLNKIDRVSLLKESIEVKNNLDWTFDYSVFHHSICELPYSNIEFLWDLHLLQIMPFETYMLFIEDKTEKALKLQYHLVKLFSLNFENEEGEYLMQTGLFTFFVQKAFPAADIFKDCEKRLRQICLDTIEKFLKEIFSSPIGSNFKNYTGLFSLWNAGILDEESVRLFCLCAVHIFLKSPDISSDLEAFKIFEDNELSVSSEHLLTLLNKVIQVLPLERKLQVLQSSMFDLNTDVNRLLVLVPAFINDQPETSTALQNLLLENTKKAYETLNYDLLLRTLLIQRWILCQSNTVPTISYRNWLQMIFKDNENLKKLECFLLLIKILSDIVPTYKNADNLKVAIDLTVPVPKEAQNIYNDYVILLKTRVSDLKPPVKAEETLEKMLSLYEILGRIPPVLMETSLLQKHKYLNEFLPTLLRPRLIPDIPDAKEKLIDALYKAGKIPNNLMETYRHKCLEEHQKLISDIAMIDENFEDD